MKLLTWLIVFIMGVAAGVLVSSQGGSHDGAYGDGVLLAAANPFDGVEARESPKDRIPEKAIAVYKDRIELDIQNAQWSTFTDTHSMEPVIMKGANAIQLVPRSEEDIKVGDIVSYKSDYAEGTIIHRVVYKGKDEKGAYFIFKGDNLPTSDPGRVRFSQMQRVVVAIVY
jgi:hypothetical protein